MFMKCGESPSCGSTYNIRGASVWAAVALNSRAGAANSCRQRAKESWNPHST